jgi:hypothetical protein
MILALLAASFLSACSGGSSGGSSNDSGDATVEALSLPNRIELTKVDSEDTSAHLTALGAKALRTQKFSAKSFNSAGTDYTKAVKNTWVDDTDALDMVNDILGVIKDTAYDEFVNEGPYKALVRKVGDSEQSQSGGSATSTTTEELMELVVDVTRESNDDPMIVKVWVFEDKGPGDQPMLIRGYFEVTEGVSDDFPYGELTAHFKGTPLDANGNPTNTVLFTMAMSVSADDEGNVVIENLEEGAENGGEGEYVWNRRVRVVANANVTQGNAYVFNQETEMNEGGPTLPDPTILQIAFNDGYFKTTEGDDDPMYFSKDNLRHRVFRYQLFDAATGDAITRNSGFPIKFDLDDDGTFEKHGYVGYYGLWAPYGATVDNGAAVKDMDGNDYTVFRAAGKLTKHTRANMLLSELNGVELSKWSDGQDSIVAWDSDSDTFITLGYRDQSNGQITYYVDGVDDEYHQAVTFQQWEGAWCEAMKAFLRLGTLYFDPDTNEATTPTDASMVYYHAEQTLDPGEAQDLTLYTWSFTLDAPFDQSDIDGAQAAEAAYWQPPINPEDPPNQTQKTYYFDAETMMLYEDAGHTIPIDMSDPNLDLEGTNYQWGYHIGPLTTAQYAQENSWQANEAPTYYTWNTGADEWNQYVTVINEDGDFVSFDAPISFAYTHTTANDVNDDAAYNGKKFRIEYDGFSVNIPWAFDEESSEWQPLINIADGTLMGPETEYVIKGVEECLIMTPITDPDVLAGITFDNEEEVGEPTLEYDATKTALVGTVPADAQLEVIKGEVID